MLGHPYELICSHHLMNSYLFLTIWTQMLSQHYEFIPLVARMNSYAHVTIWIHTYRRPCEVICNHNGKNSNLLSSISTHTLSQSYCHMNLSYFLPSKYSSPMLSCCRIFKKITLKPPFPIYFALLRTWIHGLLILWWLMVINLLMFPLLLKDFHLFLPQLAHSHPKKIPIPVQSISLMKTYFSVWKQRIHCSKWSNLPNALMVAS